MFSRRWWWRTLLVIAAYGVMVRLGIWQLDRLEGRRAFNARVQAQLDQPELHLNGNALSSDLVNMEYRSVVVEGVYIPGDEVALRNRAWGNQPGYHLVTPLRIAGSEKAVLVERGWISAEDSAPELWAKYNEPGFVQVRGLIRRSSTRPDLGRRSDPIPMPGEEPLKFWNFLNVERIDTQVSMPLLPIYIQQVPDEKSVGLPYRSEPEFDLSEGPHLGYAGQWFIFALLLATGYPVFLRKQAATRLEIPSQAQSAGNPSAPEEPYPLRLNRLEGIKVSPTPEEEVVVHD